MKLRVPLLVIVFATSACSERPLPPLKDVEPAVSNGLCLTQLKGGFVEIVPFASRQRLSDRLLNVEGPILSWGIVSPDGTSLWRERHVASRAVPIKSSPLHQPVASCGTSPSN